MLKSRMDSNVIKISRVNAEVYAAVCAVKASYFLCGRGVGTTETFAQAV